MFIYTRRLWFVSILYPSQESPSFSGMEDGTRWRREGAKVCTCNRFKWAYLHRSFVSFIVETNQRTRSHKCSKKVDLFARNCKYFFVFIVRNMSITPNRSTAWILRSNSNAKHIDMPLGGSFFRSKITIYFFFGLNYFILALAGQIYD